MLCAPRDYLYVVLPYFNFCGFKRRRQLFVEFVESIRNVPGIKIVVSEALGKAPLGRLPGVTSHLRFKTDSTIWLKENLINLAVKSLPGAWKYMAWIDADLTFLNPNWVQDTIDGLQSADVVQMWRSAVNLGPNGETIKIDKSFAYMFKGSGTKWTPNDKYGFWHTGYAWACTRHAFDTMYGLIDWAILGSADRHMAFGFSGNILQSAPGNIHPHYQKLLSEFQYKIKNLKLEWVDGTIIHHWHGSFENRKYKDRWDILTQNSYDPFKDIGLDSRGLLHFTKSGYRLEEFLKKYFIDRKEDS